VPARCDLIGETRASVFIPSSSPAGLRSFFKQRAQTPPPLELTICAVISCPPASRNGRLRREKSPKWAAPGPIAIGGLPARYTLKEPLAPAAREFANCDSSSSAACACASAPGSAAVRTAAEVPD